LHDEQRHAFILISSSQDWDLFVSVRAMSVEEQLLSGGGIEERTPEGCMHLSIALDHLTFAL
jgi:hypothetical protein